MPEQMQKMGNRILEWWKKYNTRQKVLLGSIAATLILALALLALVVSRPSMTPLAVCETTAEAAKVKEILDDSTIKYEMSPDGLVFKVAEKDVAAASILLGENGIPSQGYTLEDVFDGGFSSTEADKMKRYKRYMEDRFEDHLEQLSNVESASIDLTLPNNDGTILAQKEQAHASVILTLSGEMDEEQAYGLAQYIATELGNDDTKNILILDSNVNVLFSGKDNSSTGGTASSQLSLRSKQENTIKNGVKDVLVGSGIYDNVEVTASLNMDFSQRREVSREYSAPDGQTTGFLTEQNEFNSSSTGGVAAAPGTDPNDDTSYVLEDGNYTESETSDISNRYQYNEKVTEESSAVGAIDYENSSLAAVATNYVLYNEDILRASGELEDMSFEEYIAAHSEPVRREVDEDYYQMISNATGFPVEKISIIAYDEPVFQHSTSGRSIRDYMQIMLAVLILVLLGYVVFRSTRRERVPVVEEELSVESLLESTRENQEELENIGYNEKSETRVLLEKFVQENPEAAASLLRNWLNEEWE